MEHFKNNFMKTAQILKIEQELSLLAALGRAYFSEYANQLKDELRKLREIEIEKQLKLLS
jgi:hypothetical protein